MCTHGNVRPPRSKIRSRKALADCAVSLWYARVMRRIAHEYDEAYRVVLRHEHLLDPEMVRGVMRGLELASNALMNHPPRVN